ncbi:MAG: RNA-binding protein [Acutalibacteraceae bacterium]
MKKGDIVYSKSGRDEGRYFAVVEIIDEGFVRIADGDLRRIKNAKLKNVKHLRATGDRLERIADKLESGVQVFDSELFSALRLYDKNRE